MEQAIIRSVDFLKKNNFDAIQKEIEESMRVTTVVDVGHEYFEQFGLRSKDNVRPNVCPTNFPVLDSIEYLDGGLGGGELGVIMAPTGGGKSFWLINLGFGALQHGIDVVHYTFELSETNIGRRYDARITGIPIREIVERPEEVQNNLKEFKGGRLFIKEYPVKTATINTIKFHIGRLRSTGFNPGVIIVDYADLMRSRKGYEQKRFELESIYEDLRSFSQELKIPIWTASQTNRGGFGEELITLDKMGEAIAKAQIADFIASFSRTIEEKEKGAGKFFIAKNRFGDDGIWLPTAMNASKAFIALGKKIATDEDISKTVKKAIDGSGIFADESVSGSPLLGALYKDHKDKKI